MQIQPPGKNSPLEPAPSRKSGRAPWPQRSGSAQPDQVHLSFLTEALTRPGQVDRLRTEIAAGVYLIDPLQLSRRIIEFYVM